MFKNDISKVHSIEMTNFALKCLHFCDLLVLGLIDTDVKRSSQEW